MKSSHSRVFFDLSRENFGKGRLSYLKEFCIHISLLPFALVFKLYKTFFNLLGVLTSVLAVLLSLGLSVFARDWFAGRMIKLAKDISDWFLWPVSVVVCLLRLLFSFFIP
jgi:hypothetical protein